MSENQKTVRESHEREGSGYVWLIAGIAVLALVIAWVAFNRSGQDVLPTTAEQVEEAQQEVEESTQAGAEEVENIATDVALQTQIAAARIEARADLLALEAELEAGATYDDVQQDINEIEANIDAAYVNASGEMQTEYQEMQQELAVLEDNIQSGTGDAFESLANLFLILETEVRNEQ